MQLKTLTALVAAAFATPEITVPAEVCGKQAKDFSSTAEFLGAIGDLEKKGECTDPTFTVSSQYASADYTVTNKCEAPGEAAADGFTVSLPLEQKVNATVVALPLAVDELKLQLADNCAKEELKTCAVYQDDVLIKVDDWQTALPTTVAELAFTVSKDNLVQVDTSKKLTIACQSTTCLPKTDGAVSVHFQGLAYPAETTDGVASALALGSSAVLAALAAF